MPATRINLVTAAEAELEQYARQLAYESELSYNDAVELVTRAATAAREDAAKAQARRRIQRRRAIGEIADVIAGVAGIVFTAWLLISLATMLS